MYTQTIQSERSRESAMFQQFCSRNPEDLLSNAQQASTKDMAREYDAKQALVAMYQAKADRVGMTLSGYCKRFNVNPEA